MALTQEDDTEDGGVNLAAGPSGYYNPAFGLMMVQQPEVVAAHFASRGVEPPSEDFPEDFKLGDAHKSLGQQFAANESTNWHEVGPARAFGNWLRGGSETPAPPPSPPPPLPPPDPDRIDAAFRATGYNARLVPPEESTDLPPGGIGVDIPTPQPRPSNAPMSVKVSDLPSGGDSSETLSPRGEVTDGMNGGEEVPTPKPRPPEAPPRPKEKEAKDGGLDNFGKALAGLAAMKTPPPQTIHSPPPPHPSTQLTRSNLPQVLLGQLQRSAAPGAVLRLGEALRGR